LSRKTPSTRGLGDRHELLQDFLAGERLADPAAPLARAEVRERVGGVPGPGDDRPVVPLPGRVDDQDVVGPGVGIGRRRAGAGLDLHPGLRPAEALGPEQHDGRLERRALGGRRVLPRLRRLQAHVVHQPADQLENGGGARPAAEVALPVDASEAHAP
jgi:hypothetical protein